MTAGMAAAEAERGRDERLGDTRRDDGEVRRALLADRRGTTP